MNKIINGRVEIPQDSALDAQEALDVLKRGQAAFDEYNRRRNEQWKR